MQKRMVIPPKTPRPTEFICQLGGQIRAAALAAYVPLTFPQVNYLFASQPSSHSNRPVETITPLAKTLGLPIDTRYRDADYASLAGEVLGQGKYVGKIVLVCWHHGEIPRLAAALGIKQPRTWRGVVFDRVWSVDYAEGGPMLHDNPPNAAVWRFFPADSSAF